MQRRTFLTAIGPAGAIGTAGCGAIAGSQSLSDPKMASDSGDDWIGRSASFESGGTEIASVGARAVRDDDAIDVRIELWHRTGTSVTDITHRVAMTDEDGQHAAEVALNAPFAGDQGDPPEISLSLADRRPGILVDVDDLDDLADETITMKFRVEAYSETIETLTLDSEVELDDSGLLGGGYTLDAELKFANSELTT